MTLSPAGLAKIAHSEGFRAEAYPDHKGQSIGYGHLIRPGEMWSFSGPITQERAMDLLKEDAGNAEAAVNRFVTVPLTQDQFDALVDFAYNEGVGALETIASTLNRKDYGYTATRMKLYNKMRDAHGNLVESKGLAERRAEEAKAFEA